MSDASVKIAEGPPPSNWNERIRDLPGANIFQTSEWAALSTSYLLTRSITLTLEKQHRLRAALVIERRAPAHMMLFERPGGGSAIRVLRALAPQLTFARGPICAPDITSEESGQFAEAMVSVARHARAQSITGTLAIQGEGLPPDNLSEALRSCGMLGAAEATYLVRLDMPDEDLRRALRPAARKALRHVETSGIMVRRVTDRNELPAYHRFMVESRSRYGHRTYSVRNLTSLWDKLGPADNMAIFVAEHRGEVVGGLGVWIFSGVAVEFGAAQSERASQEKLFAGDALKWAALLWARERGARWFDLAGVSAQPSDAKEEGIRRFKEKWGGSLVVAPTFAWASRRLHPSV